MYVINPQPAKSNDGSLLIDMMATAYSKTKDPALLEPIVMYYMPFIRNMVDAAMDRCNIQKTTVADFQDYLSVGKIAFIMTLNRYNPDYGPLDKWASSRVFGAVVDEFRDLSPLTRDQHRIERAWNRYLIDQAMTGGGAHASDFALMERISTYKLQTILGLKDIRSLDTLVGTEDEPSNLDGYQFHYVYVRERKERLKKAILGLRPRERLLMKYRLRGMTQKRVSDRGVIGDINEHRVSQIEAVATKKLRKKLGVQETP